MASPRSPSFYANFFRAVRSCEPTTYRSIRSPPSQPARTKLNNTLYRSQSTFQNRYGPAATEGLPPPPKPQEQQLQPAPPEPKKEEPVNAQQTSSKPEEREVDEPAAVPEEPETQSASPEQPEIVPVPEVDTSGPLPNRELDMVLSIPSPNELRGKTSRHPHLEPSPYEHHFDTYSLVQDLASSQDGFTEEQAITVMKAIRLMLAINLDIAKEGLVSKSDIENESYLFRAACSELRTTLQTSRFAEHQRQRTSRAGLQHEHDILNQKVNQDVLNMREDLKAMFNDRKMGLQEEKRKIDSKISELNYEITVLLNSEAKSEVEGLRWVLTRRAALAILSAAFMTLCALQYYSIKSREQAEIEKKRKAANKAQAERMAANDSARYATVTREGGTQTEGVLEESLG